MTRLRYNEVITGFPSYRVFVAGFEVTEDCTDVSSTWVNGRAPSFVNLTLLNLNDKYVIRRDDMVSLYPGEIAQFAKAVPDSDLSKTYDAIVNQKQIPLNSVADYKSTKSKMVRYKQNPAFSIPVNPTNEFTGAPQGTKPYPIYPFIEGKSIFHQNDPVRVFMQDPFDPEVWYYFFAGFITQITDSVNGVALEKTITINCEDVSKSLRYCRYTINPGIRDPELIKTGTDLIKFSGYSSPLVNKNFQEAADYTVFGDLVKNNPPSSALESVPVVVQSTGARFNRLILKSGAGNFKPLPLKQRCYTIAPASNPERSTTTLENWQNVILNHVVTLNDLDILRAQSNNPESSQTVIQSLKAKVRAAQNANNFVASLTQEIITTIGTDTANYPVDGGTLLMLLPEGLGKLGEDVVAKDFVSSISMTSEFKDRRSLMYDLVDRVEFCFYADPKGNLIIEFPLYDFEPSDFVSPNTQSLKRGAKSQTLDSVRFTHTNPNGTVVIDNERRFTIEDEALESFDAVDDDAPVRTICQCNPVVGIGNTALFAGQMQAPIRNPKAVRLDTLIPIYGPRVIQTDPRKPVETAEAAIISAALELNKVNSESYTYKLPILPRFSAWLNRPMIFRHRNHIATTYSITHRVSWANSASTTIGFKYARGWAGQVDQAAGKLIYVPIGGENSRPVNYAVLFAHNRTANNNPSNDTSGSGTQSNGPSANPRGRS